MAKQASSPSVKICERCNNNPIGRYGDDGVFWDNYHFSNDDKLCWSCHENYQKPEYYRHLLNNMETIGVLDRVINDSKPASFGAYANEILSGHIYEIVDVSTLEKKRYLIFPLTVEE